MKYSSDLDPELEAELVSKMRAGDQAARDRLVASLAPWVVRLVYRYCRPGNPLFEELRQEAFLAFLGALDRFDPSRSRLITYATHRIRGALADYFRAVGRDQKLAQRPADELARSAAVCFELDLAELLDDSAAIQKMIGSIERLPERWRDVVRGHLAGETLKMIGARLGITKQRVGAILKSAIAALRQARQVRGVFQC